MQPNFDLLANLRAKLLRVTRLQLKRDRHRRNVRFESRTRETFINHCAPLNELNAAHVGLSLAREQADPAAARPQVELNINVEWLLARGQVGPLNPDRYVVEVAKLS